MCVPIIWGCTAKRDVFGDVKKGYINIDTDSRQWKFDDPSVAIVHEDTVLTRQ